MVNGALHDCYKELCLKITSHFFPDYERAGVIHFLKVVRMITDLISTSLLIASCVGDSWINRGDIASIGLWRHCWVIQASDGGGIEHCQELTGEEMSFGERSCRIFIVLSCLCMFSAIMLSVFGIFTSRSHGIFHSISTLSAVLCTVIALVIFTVSTPSGTSLDGRDESFGWAYILGWTSVTFSFVCWLLIYCTMSVFND